MRTRDGSIVLAGVVCVLALLLASCVGTQKIGLCAAVPGAPGEVCVDVYYQGKTKRLVLPVSMVEGAATVGTTPISDP